MARFRSASSRREMLQVAGNLKLLCDLEAATRRAFAAGVSANQAEPEYAVPRALGSGVVAPKRMREVLAQSLSVRAQED